jgi:hypothetical protein
MKNKIVKALVLASIVSMTMTGTAAMTFAEPAKTIDEQAKDVTTKQTTVDEKKAAFDKANAYVEAKEAAKKALNALQKQEMHTGIEVGALEENNDVLGDGPTQNAAYTTLKKAYIDLVSAEKNWENGRNEQNPQEDVEAVYKTRKAAFETAMKVASEDEGLKDVFAELDEVYKSEDAPRAAFEDAMKAVKAANKDYDEEKLIAAGKAYEKALGELKPVVTAYDEATKELPPIYRLYHPGTGEHLYTDSKNERDTLVKGGIWQDEKVAMLSAKKSDDAIPVYRVCYPLTGDHHYTTSKNEVDTLIKTQGWVDEGIAFYAMDTGKGVPVYRLYNKGLKLGAHHFTTGLNEYNALESHGWLKEGAAFDAMAKDYVDTSTIKTAVKTEDKRIAKTKEALGLDDNWEEFEP